MSEQELQAQAQEAEGLEQGVQPEEGQGEDVDIMDVLAGELSDEDEAQPEGAEAVEPEEDTGEEDGQQDGQLAPPEPWSQEHKEAFHQLDRQSQEVLLDLAKGQEKAFQKRQEQVASKQRELEVWGEFHKRLSSDPQYWNHVFHKYDPQTAGQEQQPPQQGKPTKEEPPEDPIEAVEWRAVQKAKQEFNDTLRQRDQRHALGEQQRIMQQAQQQMQEDPDREAVFNRMGEYIETLPGDVVFHTLPNGQQVLDEKKSWGPRARETMLMLQNPLEMAQMFFYTKRQLGEGQGQPQQEEKPSRQAGPVRRETKAPLLEDGGQSVPTRGGAANRQKKISQLHKRITSGDAAESDFGDYLEEIGIIDLIAP